MADLYFKDALSGGKLEEFIRQQEAAGIGSVDEGAFFQAAERVIKPAKSED